MGIYLFVPKGKLSRVRSLWSNFAVAAVVYLAAFAVNAQAVSVPLEDEVNAELDSLYQQNSVPVNSSPVSTVAPQRAAPTVRSESQAPAVSPQAKSLLQRQPPTYIEATPLMPSRAEALRQNRQDAEKETETKIVEKLEQSRLEDEKRRSQALFGERFEQLNQKEKKDAEVAPATTSTPVAVPQMMLVPVMPAAPAPAPTPAPIVEKTVAPPPGPSLSEIEDVVDNKIAAREQEQEKTVAKQSVYVSATGGATTYPGIRNIKSRGSLGVAIGMEYDENLLTELGLSYSTFDVEQRDGLQICNGFTCELYPRITTLEQYNFTLGVKYQFLTGILRPNVGALVSYTNRTYQDSQLAIQNNNANSQAIDGGLSLGVALQMSKRFSLGAEYRYFSNLTSWTSSDNAYRRSMNQTVLQSRNIESLNYESFGAFARFTF